MTLKVNSNNTNIVCTETPVIRLDATIKCALSDKFSEAELRQFVYAGFKNEENTFLKNRGVKEHFDNGDKIFYSFVDSTQKTHEMGCADVSIEKFNVVKNSGVDLNPVRAIANCVKDNANIVEIFYFVRKKEFWLIVSDNQYSRYKEVIKSCQNFEEIYQDFEYLVLRREQIDFDEMPQTNVELKRDVDE